MRNCLSLVIFLFGVSLAAGCSDQGESEKPAASVDDASETAQAPEDVAGVADIADSEEVVDKAAVAGKAYLAINARKPGVQVTESGLQFEILEQGSGRSPSLTSRVVTHYHGTFTDGEVFDSSVERGEPAEFPVNRVIKGWTEALQMMKEGDTWRLVIPSELAYGERGAGGGRIPPNSVLIFEVELLEVKD